MDKTTVQVLEELGLSEKEVNIYVTLLKLGPSTIVELSKATAIKRTTAHNNVDELISRGLISQLKVGGRRKIVAEDPSRLENLIKNKKRALEDLQTKLGTAVAFLQDSKPEYQDLSSVQVKYYEGDSGVRSVYEEALSSKELRSYVDLTQTPDIFPANSDLFLQTKKNNPDIKIYEIVQDKPGINEVIKVYTEKLNFYYKLISPESINIEAVDVLIYDDKIAIVNVKDHTSAVVINNSDYYDLFKSIFDFVWNTLP